MDGVGLAHRIRPDLPVLLTTGYSEAAVNVRGDFVILRKPYEIHQLSAAIGRLLLSPHAAAGREKRVSR